MILLDLHLRRALVAGHVELVAGLLAGGIDRAAFTRLDVCFGAELVTVDTPLAGQRTANGALERFILAYPRAVSLVGEIDGADLVERQDHALGGDGLQRVRCRSAG